MRVRVNDDLILDKFRLTDGPTLVRYLNDEETIRTILPLPSPYTEADAREWLVFNQEQYQHDPYPHNFAVRLNGKELIGSVGMRFLFTDPSFKHQAEIGYIIYKPWWNKGYASAIVPAYCRYVFEHFPLVRLTAIVFSGNKASERVLLKSGFRQEGFLRKYIKKHENYIDCGLFAIIKDDIDNE